MVDVEVDEAANVDLVAFDLGKLEKVVTRMAQAACLSEGNFDEFELSLRLTDNPSIAILNREYRGKDSATDVLAFAQREGEAGHLAGPVLGDIVISVERAAEQAKESLDAELFFLSAHGLCHLLGYDHQDDQEEFEMNDRMKLLMAEASRLGPVSAA